MIEIIPGILEQEWSKIEERIRLAAPFTPWIQIDVADNTLVPNATFLDFEKFKPIAQKTSLEAHLMVAHPEKYTRQLADSGFKRLIAHVEGADPRLFLDQARYESVEVGIAVDGPTEIEQLEPYLEEVDCVLVMLIEAGFSGQELQPENLEKIKTIHRNVPDLPIEVDGGINEVTARLVKDAGATRLVTTTYIYKDPQKIFEAIEELKNA